MKKKHKRRLAVLERIVTEQSARIARLEKAVGISGDAPLAGAFKVDPLAIREMMGAAVEAARSVKMPAGPGPLDHTMKRVMDKAEAP